VLAHRQALLASGELEARRRRQSLAWMWSLVDEGLRAAFRAHPAVAAAVGALEREVESQKATPAAAARRLLSAFLEV
jgi:LAO/AO transport system kinase